jgi:hypothetical protein
MSREARKKLKVNTEVNNYYRRFLTLPFGWGEGEPPTPEDDNESCSKTSKDIVLDPEDLVPFPFPRHLPPV